MLRNLRETITDRIQQNHPMMQERGESFADNDDAVHAEPERQLSRRISKNNPASEARRRVWTHPTSIFRPRRPQRPDSIPNADCVMSDLTHIPPPPHTPAFLPPLISHSDVSCPASHLRSIRTPPQGTLFSFCFRAWS